MGMKTLTLLSLVLGVVIAGPVQAGHSSDYRSHDRGRAAHDYRDRGGPRIIVYEDANFRGESLTLYPGESIRNLKRAGFSGGKIMNDQISSIRVMGGASVLLFDHPGMRGQVLRVTSNIRDLESRRMPDGHVVWNDRISSLRVRGSDFHRHDDSPRRPVAKNPEQMIKKAYLEVLQRPVDREGLRYYRGLVIDQGWSDRMVRNHLRRSVEYRSESVDRIIHRAYEDILDRRPDPMGLANYRRLMIRENWSEQRLRDALRRSAWFGHRSLAWARASRRGAAGGPVRLCGAVLVNLRRASRC